MDFHVSTLNNLQRSMYSLNHLLKLSLFDFCRDHHLLCGYSAIQTLEVPNAHLRTKVSTRLTNAILFGTTAVIGILSDLTSNII